MILLPALPESERVFEHHRAVVRTELDNFGLADPALFGAKLAKVG